MQLSNNPRFKRQITSKLRNASSTDLLGPVRLHEPYLSCLNPAWVSFTYVWGLGIPHALLLGPNSVGGGCQSRHGQDFGQIRDWRETYLFACNRHEIRHHDVSDNSQLAPPITAADTTSPYMLVGGTYKLIFRGFRNS